MSFGETLKKLRKEHALSQRELASKVDVQWTYISKLENGIDSASELLLSRLAHALDVDRHEFIIAAGKIPSDFESLIRRNKAVRAYLKEELRKEEKG